MAIANPPGTRAFFAKRLRELRIPRGFRTARKLAQELGIDENRYTRYERAEVEPDLDLLVRIAELLEVTPNDLLGIYPQEPMTGGFAESAGPDQVNSAATTNDHKRAAQKACIWALSRELVLTIDEAVLDAHYDLVVRSTGGAGQLCRIAMLFNAIETDTFKFVSELSLSSMVGKLPHHRQERIAKLIERVTTGASE